MIIKYTVNPFSTSPLHNNVCGRVCVCSEWVHHSLSFPSSPLSCSVSLFFRLIEFFFLSFCHPICLPSGWFFLTLILPILFSFFFCLQTDAFSCPPLAYLAFLASASVGYRMKVKVIGMQFLRLLMFNIENNSCEHKYLQRFYTHTCNISCILYI